MSEMMMRTRSVILAIDAQRHYEPTVKIRMASFATFLLRVARANGEWSEQEQQVLEAWQEAQQGGTLDQAITDVLDNWMRLPNFEPGKRYDAIGLERELTGLRITWGWAWWLGKVRWLTRALRSASRAYRNRYGFGFSERTSGHRYRNIGLNPTLRFL